MIRNLKNWILALVVFMIATACAQPSSDSTTSDTVPNPAPVALEEVANGTYFTTALKQLPGVYVFCFGSQTECQTGQGTNVDTKLDRENLGIRFLKTVSPIVLRHNVVVRIMGVQEGVAARAIIRTFKIVDPKIQTQDVGPLPTLQPGQPGEFKLKFGSVFNQYEKDDTNWCWAFSGYHTLRTYYENNAVAEGNNAGLAWKSALEELNSQSAFWGFMEKNVPKGRLGSPHMIKNILVQQKGLPTDKQWGYGGESDRVETLQLVEQNLRKGIPTGYCRDGHCITIYGFATDGNQITKFFVANSSGRQGSQTGTFQSESAQYVRDNYTDIWTIVSSSRSHSYGGEAQSESEQIDLEAYYEEHPLTQARSN